MTPQERRLVDDLFARLSELERAPREPDAAAAINEGLQRAPNAIYALVQTVLLQEEALKRAHERLQEYEGGEPQQPEQRGFLDSMRDQFFGGGAPQRGSVPSVGRGGAFGQQGGMQQPMAAQQQGGFAGGGSFLGTAAAAAAGVIGGSMLMNSISSMMGGGKAFASESGGGNEKSSPWSDSSNNELSKDAGASDVGNNNRQGLFDEHNNDNDGGDDFDGDMGSGDGDF